MATLPNEVVPALVKDWSAIPNEQNDQTRFPWLPYAVSRTRAHVHPGSEPTRNEESLWVDFFEHANGESPAFQRITDGN